MFSLSHLKVLELASVLAGPSVGQFFAELGAEVIKVENKSTGGDVTRTWKLGSEKEGDLSAYFCSVNWGKKSVAVDLTTAEGKAVSGLLAARADIIIASYKPGDAQKLGVDYSTIEKINPDVIYGRITGYGNDNPRVGYDAVIQAEAGFMDLNGATDGPPVKMPVALMDVLAAHQLKEGLLLALLRKQQTGEGSLVDVSLIQAAVASLANQAANWLVAGHVPKRQGSSHPNIVPYGDFFETADKQRILLAVGNDKQFRELCEIIGAEDLKISDLYRTNQLRVINRRQLRNELEKRICTIDGSDLLFKLHKRKIPAGKIQNLKEVFEMDEAKELLIQSAQLKGAATFVARVNGQLHNRTLMPPPRLGEHTDEVLREIGYP